MQQKTGFGAYLNALPAEVLLAMMKSSSSFSDLASLIRSSKNLHQVWEENEYGICGAVAQNIFDDLWEDVHQLLVQQGRLNKYFAQKKLEVVEGVWIGILKGGTKIGKAEAHQLLRYKKVLRENTIGFTRLSFRHRRSRDMQAIKITSLGQPLDSERQFRVDRAFYRCWDLILIGIPDTVQKSRRMFYQGRAYHEAWLEQQNSKEAITRYYQKFEHQLQFKDREMELREIWQFISYMKAQPHAQLDGVFVCGQNEDIFLIPSVLWGVHALIKHAATVHRILLEYV